MAQMHILSLGVTTISMDYMQNDTLLHITTDPPPPLEDCTHECLYVIDGNQLMFTLPNEFT